MANTVSDCDPSTWWNKARNDLPLLDEMRERLQVLPRTISFASTYRQPRSLERKTLLELVIAHLKLVGLTKSQEMLEHESGVQLPADFDLEIMMEALKKAVKATENLWDIVMNERNLPDIHEARANQLIEMGLKYEADSDTNIWLEPDENIFIEEELEEGEEEQLEDGMYIYGNRKTPKCEVVKQGSLNKLVEKLTSHDKHDLHFVKTFLTTYQTFCRPQTLLEKLKERFFVPPVYLNQEPNRGEVVRKIRLRVCSLLKIWITEYYYDLERDEGLLKNMRSFINEMRTSGEESLANIVQSSLSKKENEKRQEWSFSTPPPEPIVPKNIFSERPTFQELDPVELARQMTLIEFRLFSKIKPCKLLNLAWNKPKLKHLAPHTTAIIQRFNETSTWVATTIVSEPSLRARAKIFGNFISLAKALKDLNNFNSMVSILAGFSFASVHRLKFTLECLKPNLYDSWQEMKVAMNPEASYKAFRDALRDSHPPCLPYLGVFLSDLVFIDENPDYLEHPSNTGTQLINFAKRYLMARVINKIEQYQQTPYNLQPVHQIREMLLNLPHMDETTLFRKSLNIEPRKAKWSELVQ